MEDQKTPESFIVLLTRIDERTKWLIKDRKESKAIIDGHIETSEGFREQVKVNSNFRVIIQRIFIGLTVSISAALFIIGFKHFSG